MTTLMETSPTMALSPYDIANLVDDLRAYHAIASPLCQCRAQREWAADYLHVLLLDIPRTSIEPMRLALRGADANAICGLQQFVGAGAWSDQPMLERHWGEVEQTLGDEDWVLTLDGSDFLPQGRESVGVTRQYYGAVGKRANCQAGVFLGYASYAGYTWWDRRRYLPQEWREDERYADRRRTGGVPHDITVKTKPELGGAMMRAVSLGDV
jgi:SRSO17 transposase